MAVSRSVIHKGLRDNLVEMVENNIDEIEYYLKENYLEIKDPYDMYLEYGDGFLEIDDDFMKSVNGIVTSLYDKNGLVYGDSTWLHENSPPEFSDGAVRSIDSSGEDYYIYDKKIDLPDGNELWIRGVAPAESSISQVNIIIRIVLMFIPVLVVISIAGGYIIAISALKPVESINKAAESISEGNDLSRRIEIKNGNSELHSIANSFNSMFERLENSFKKEQQLTSDISHELRTPVSVIYSQCQLSLESDSTVEEYRDSLELIKRQSKKMSGIINDMLAFARLERGAEKILLEKINLSECISYVCEDMSLINDKNITLKSLIEPDIYIDGDFELITRMTVNLISNAYKYGKVDGHIDVTLKTTDKDVVLQVEDDGIGIEKDDMPKIFDRFFRGEKARNSSGTGLGLSFVKEIAEIHGAEVRVDSKKDVGSTFTVSFKK